MKWNFDIGTSKDDNPSATAHGKAVGAVHTYALAREKSRTEESRFVELDKCWMTAHFGTTWDCFKLSCRWRAIQSGNARYRNRNS